MACEMLSHCNQTFEADCRIAIMKEGEAQLR
jgi:hypothetical protein